MMLFSAVEDGAMRFRFFLMLLMLSVTSLKNDLLDDTGRLGTLIWATALLRASNDNIVGILSSNKYANNKKKLIVNLNKRSKSGDHIYV